MNSKFPITLGLRDTALTQSHLLDNDGNMYVTYWDVTEGDYELFLESEKRCEALINDRRLFLSSYTIHDYDLNDIEPSLFKPYVACLKTENHVLVESVAHAPEYFELSFTRTLSTAHNYMPVGVKYRVQRTGVEYREVFRDTIACEKQVVRSGSNVKETYGYYFAQVSIEKYVDAFRVCLEGLGYQVEKTAYHLKR